MPLVSTGLFLKGPRTWSMIRDHEGHREYHITYRVISKPGLIASIINVSASTDPTITTGTSHGLSPDDYILILGVEGAVGINGFWQVLDAPTASTFTVSSQPTGTYTSGGGLYSSPVADGPYNIHNVGGLPQPGDSWNVGNDRDDWAFCLWDMDVKPVLTDGDPGTNWDITLKFSTKPPDNDRDVSEEWTDPVLSQQPKRSAHYAKDHEEAAKDRFGKFIINSAHEQLRGHQVTFESHYLQVKIDMNVNALDTEDVDGSIDTVNYRPLWGYPARTVKLSGISWKVRYFGHGNFYYVYTFEFDIKINKRTIGGDIYYSGHDRDLLDEGTKVLNGHYDGPTGNWVLDDINGKAPNPNNPDHFNRYKDRQGENTRVVLNGFGVPAKVVVTPNVLFISVKAPNTGQDLEDETYWIALGAPWPNQSVTNPLGTPPIWGQTIPGVVGGSTLLGFPFYSTGTTIIGQDGNTYVSLKDTVQIPGGASGDWLLLTSITNQGNYSAAATYAVGDFVYAGGEKTTSGTIHVEKFDETDFTFLGLPLEL